MNNISRAGMLQHTVDAIQKRWGQNALQQLSALPPASERPRIPTGADELDHILGGGIPTGTLVELSGQPTSGAATTALDILSLVQQTGDLVSYIDPGAVLDAAFALHREVDPDTLLLVQPDSTALTLPILSDLAALNVFKAIVVDTTSLQPLPPAALQRLQAQVRTSSTVILLLTRHLEYPTRPQFAGHLSLHFKRQRWLFDGGDICGFTSQVTILKDKQGHIGKQAAITIKLDDLHRAQEVAA